MNTLYVYAYLGFTPELYAELGPDYFLQNQHFKIAFKSGMVRYELLLWFWLLFVITSKRCLILVGLINQSNEGPVTFL